MRLNKEKLVSPASEVIKKYRTPKNSRFFAKMRRETEMLATPKTNKKKQLQESDAILTGGKREPCEADSVTGEYEVCL